MRTISQVAELTGISTRTLQYYDEIGLLKPSELTESGYRLYDDEALQKLQQILFFKELGFKLINTSPVLDNIISAVIFKILYVAAYTEKQHQRISR